MVNFLICSTNYRFRKFKLITVQVTTKEINSNFISYLIVDVLFISLFVIDCMLEKFMIMYRFNEFLKLDIGVPQGSILEPLEFINYTTDLDEIITEYNLIIILVIHRCILASLCILKALIFRNTLNATIISKNYLKLNVDRTEAPKLCSQIYLQPQTWGPCQTPPHKSSFPPSKTWHLVGHSPPHP